MSDNGKYVYLGSNDDLGVSTKNGASGTYIRTLHVDENSDPSGTNIYSQGEIIALCCSSSGRNVFVVVGNQNTNKDFKIARSYDYGSTWTVSNNFNVGTLSFKSIQIATDLTGAK
ncbi:hypothetical protein MHBO_003468, partial [Bonamia ostreae]